jgi:hypothetical protein
LLFLGKGGASTVSRRLKSGSSTERLRPDGRCIVVPPPAQAVLKAILIITINPSSGKWAKVFGDAKLTTALLDRLTKHRHILDTRKDSCRLNNSITNKDTKVKKTGKT